MNNSLKWRIFYWFVKQRWPLIGVIALFLCAMEIYEPIMMKNSGLHWQEFIIYAVFLVFIGVLIELLLRASKNQNQTLKILDHKHKLSLELAKLDDWGALTSYIVNFPSSIAPVIDETCLFVHNPIMDRFEHVAFWQKPGKESAGSLCSEETCQKCVASSGETTFFFRRCELETTTEGTAGHPAEYCIPLKYGQELLALMRIKLEVGQTLEGEQKDIFRNVGSEMAFALRLGQDRTVFSQMQSAEMALAERRTVSHYLHDNLSQNLAYLHLKLGQLSSESQIWSPELVRADLERMSEAANQAYEIVRGTLEATQPATTPTLNNLLLEHAHKISQRANFTVTVQSAGMPMTVSPDIQRAVFYVFQEAINNIEKHAHACKVDIILNWEVEHLSVTIRDNGVGFDSQSIELEKHFGLKIMRERVSKVNGQIEIASAKNSGTTVMMRVPLSFQSA